MRLLLAGLAATALLAILLPGWTHEARPPDRTYLQRVSASNHVLGTCRQWLYGSLTYGKSVTVCVWDGRRLPAKIHAASDGTGR